MAIEVTSGAVVYRWDENHQLQYLLLESQNKGHFWGFPKGHVEAGEDLEQTAHREIKEETKLDLAIDTSFHVYTEYDLPNGNRKQMTLYTAEVQGDDGVSLQAEEILNAGWFDYADARQRLTYDNLKELLDKANAHLLKAAGDND
ncbi:bis(5'-nucleosyl)-tetraphosphatase [Limosilactobacillus difficilis]|uniref:bis(5'-nucleosyl)-tetraphosphatase n=1 Tax=Limosilactobacillus difficilis TaxID=2991838 RepID=UPI0024BBD629|nr:NUDIX domain-containing protein [Limosilactobacillus difficilis]